MNRDHQRLLGLTTLLLSLTFAGSPAAPQRTSSANATTLPQSTSELERLFHNPPDDSRIMMRWWWFGPAVTKSELEREMRLMKEGGIGGFEIQPVYPLALDDEATGITRIRVCRKKR